MRQIARYTGRDCGSAALSAPGVPTAGELDGSPARYPCKDAKDDCASLLPGGMTPDAEPGVSWFLHASSPEPVIGYGGVKGIFAYYQSVLYFGA
ncbi:MAG: hypothetical protein WC382_05615 [Methanoregulaceae archaeon]|jgi:hypothetical protein